jgi:hypothetical protein
MTCPKSQAGSAFRRVTGIGQTIFSRQLVQDPVLFEAFLQAELAGDENADAVPSPCDGKAEDNPPPPFGTPRLCRSWNQVVPALLDFVKFEKGQIPMGGKIEDS